MTTKKCGIKNKKKTRKFKKLSCSPKKNNLKYSCFTSTALIKLKNIWNKNNPHCKIITNEPKKIWQNLRDNMIDTCNSETCWIKEMSVKNHIDIDINKFNKMFAPKSPKEWRKNRYEWLSTNDIQNAMEQWESYDETFKFFGASPLDYDKKINNTCVWEKLCKFNLKNELLKNHNKLGIVFNLDKHDRPGSHWVAVYIDTIEKKIIFFDSYGDNPPSRIMNFCRNVKKQAKKLNLNYKIIINKKRHQYKDGQCGMYSMYFIISLLTGIKFDVFNKNTIKDKKMCKFRKKYFNIPN